MGGCVSKTPVFIRGKSKKNLKKKRKGKMKKSVSFHLSDSTSPYGNVEEAWFDSATILESNCSDEDFVSVPDDMLSLNSFETASLPNDTSLEDPSLGLGDVNTQHASFIEKDSSASGSSNVTSARNSVSAVARSSVYPIDADSEMESDGPPNEVKHAFLVEMSSSANGSASRHDGLLVDCGILPNNCLPSLASTVQSAEKRRYISSTAVNARKNAPLKLSFKCNEGNASLRTSKALLQRPIAGAQVPFCPLEKKVPNTWSEIEPGSYRVRGVNYLRDKKKEFAPNYAAYYPFGVDVFLSPKKIDHVARFVELPIVDSCKDLPPILVVNVQIPLYPPTIFNGETDGEGTSFVLYFKLSDNYVKEISPQFQENIRKLIDNEAEKVRGFTSDTIVPFRERLKILGRVANIEDLPLSAPERKLMSAYNEKPFLSRPQHEFYLGENYFEIDIDMHRFNYISRKGFDAFLDRLKLCDLDVGLTIQGNKPEELPEQILCCIRLNEIDYVNYQQLRLSKQPFE